MIDKRPALIAQCRTTADVVDAVELARDGRSGARGARRRPRRRRSRRHRRRADDRPVAPMKGIHVDPPRRTVRAQPGLTWREFNRAAAVHGLATTGGVVSTTGIAGLTLGGGIGWLMGKYGLTVDNLLSAEVVTADGDVITASDDEHPDLFWALRGGGGNFGVVTSFEYRAPPGATTCSPDRCSTRLPTPAPRWPFHREFTASVPDELTVGAALLHAPDGSGTKVAGARAVPLRRPGGRRCRRQAAPRASARRSSTSCSRCRIPS